MKKILVAILLSLFFISITSCNNNEITVKYDEPVTVDNITYKFMHIGENKHSNNDEVSLRFYLVVTADSKEYVNIEFKNLKFKNNHKTIKLSIPNVNNNTIEVSYYEKYIPFDIIIDTFTDEGNYSFSFTANGTKIKFIL
jgi:uncharacterized lipoprotein YehR (DUF1307 family)